MYELIRELYPICRSITGDGLRETLRRISKYISITINEVPSRTTVLDWTVPLEWNIRAAHIRDSTGAKVVDFADSNLHVVGYSEPIAERMNLEALKEHLHSIPEKPDVIPYRTSYYSRDWGFCLRHSELERLDEQEYEVLIDSSLAEGSLTYGELVVPGELPDEVLISTHCCHPSLCNDNLSGIAVATFLAAEMIKKQPRHTFRFLFIPGTIGSITWLARNRESTARIKAGLVVTGLGDRGTLHYKKSRRGDTTVDLASSLVVRGAGGAVEDFSPYGYDERQYCSPGFDLPVGVLSRTPHGTYPEYHTSADNLEFVTAESLAGSLQAAMEIIFILENNQTFRNTAPFGEPQLGRRGLYARVGGQGPQPDSMAMLWVLNLSDGTNDLLSIARRSALPFESIFWAAEALRDSGLLVRHSPSRPNSPSSQELGQS